eukprot:1162456-Rhodomonas_salina.3
MQYLSQRGSIHSTHCHGFRPEVTRMDALHSSKSSQRGAKSGTCRDHSNIRAKHKSGGKFKQHRGRKLTGRSCPTSLCSLGHRLEAIANAV